MLGYIRDSKTPKEAWEKLKKISAANTVARKLQLRQELNSRQQRDMSITSYTLKIKELCDALGSIDVVIDDDEMVQIMPRQPSIPIQHNENGNTRKGEYSLILRPPINIVS